MGDLEGSPRGGDGSSPESEKHERLSYLADLVNELREMAAKEGCETLAGLLALSHAEAMRKAKAKSTRGLLSDL